MTSGNTDFRSASFSLAHFTVSLSDFLNFISVSLSLSLASDCIFTYAMRISERTLLAVSFRSDKLVCICSWLGRDGIFAFMRIRSVFGLYISAPKRCVLLFLVLFPVFCPSVCSSVF